MSLRSRRILFAFFVLLFIILVPVVLLYATGHTINWQRLSLEKSGSLLIESSPSGATIFLNGQSVHKNVFGIINDESQETTPTRIKDLAPGEYTVRLERYGYWPWEEQLRLSPGEALNLGTVQLFNQAKPQLLIKGEIIESQSSPDGSAIALLTNDDLIIINTETQEQSHFSVVRVGEKNIIRWSRDSQRLILNSQIIDRNKKTVETVQPQGKPGNFHWDRNNSSVLYFLSNGKMFIREIENGKERPIDIQTQLKGQAIVDFDIYDKQAYVIVKDTAGNNNLLMGTLGKDMSSMTLPASNYQFIENNFNRPMLLSGRNLYIVDKPLPLFVEPRLLEVTNRYTNGRGIGSSFVYSTPLELRRWDNENQEYILTRFGSPINYVWPLTKNAAVLAALSDSIRLYVNGRSPFILTLANVTEISDLSVSTNEKTIYFVGNYQDTKGLFSLTLSEN